MNNLKHRNFNSCADKRCSTSYVVLNTYCNLYQKTKIILITSLLFFCIICAGKTVEAKITEDATKALEPVATVYGVDASKPQTISQIIASIIQYALSFLGVIFLIFLIYAGFLYMTAAGEQEKITKAKDILQSSVIGLIIILSSYTITYFVLQNLIEAQGMRIY